MTIELENTFYGQKLDCPDGYLTEWHNCPNCDKNLCDGCECENSEMLCKELSDLYKEMEKYL